MTARLAIIVGALLGASGVSLGAYQAHGLEKQLAAWELPDDQRERRLHNAEVGVHFQLIHALALVGVGAVARGGSTRCLAAATVLFGLGALLFCGGLYAIVFLGPVLHRAIVPAGGFMLILGWLFVALHASFCWSNKSAKHDG